MALDNPPLPQGATYDDPPLPAGATYDEPQLPSGATRDSAPKMDLSEKPKKGLFDRAKDVAETTLTGGVLGAFAPELTQGAGMVASMFPLTAPAGPPLMALGSSMKGSRLAQSAIGALSGFGEEVAGQTAQAYEQPKYKEELWRLAGGAVTPDLANLLKYTAGKLIGVTGIATKGDVEGLISAIAKDAGIDEKQLTPSQRKYIEEVAQRIRGGATTQDFAKTVYSALERGAEQLVDKFNRQASTLESQAQNLIDATQAANTVRTQQALNKVSALQSQFETVARDLLDSGRQRADAILKNATAKAEEMRRSAVSPQTQQIQEIEVKNMLKNARAEADRVVADASQRVNRLRDIASKARTSGTAKAEQAAGQLTRVGQPQTPTQTGTSIRDAVTPIFNKLKDTRSQNAEKFKGDAFSFAATKEANGQMPKDTQSFKKGMAELDKLIADTTLSDIKSPLQRIRNALDPVQELDGIIVGKPAKFESLEQIRRFLRDRSYGLPAEGYDAIGQQQAGKLADMVEGIQREFSPSIGKFLEQYRKDSEPLRIFKTKLGEAIVGKEEFDMGRFATDPATLGSKFFKSETGVKDLVTLLGGDVSQAEKIARGYVSDQLRTANSKQVLQKINDWRDWLPQFKSLEGELKSAADRLAQSERIGGRRDKLSTALRTEASGLPEKAGTQARRIESDAEKQAAKLEAQGRKAEADAIRRQEAEATRLETAAGREAAGAVSAAEAQAKASGKAVERQRGRIETEAERTGQRAMTDAEREATKLRGQAGKLSDEGEQIKKQILGDAFPAERIQQLILQGKPSLWQEVGPIIAGNPKAKEAFGEALSQVLADAVEKSPRSAVEAFNLRIRPAMESTNLLEPRKLAELQAEINRINQTVDGPKKIKLMTRLIKGAITGEAARGLSNLTNPFDTIPSILGY
jgi:hypothetical protein